MYEIFFVNFWVMNTFIRQSGRDRQKNTDIYTEIQINITTHIVIGDTDVYKIYKITKW